MVKRLAPLSGVVFFVLIVASSLVGSNDLRGSSSPAKVLAYYQAHQGRMVASGVLTVLAVVVGVIFYGQLRDYLRLDEGSRGWTATAFGGVLLFAASGGVSAGASFAVSDSPSHLSASTAQMLNLMSMDVGAGFASSGIAIMLVCFGWAIVKSRLLPAWLGWVAFPLALTAIIPPVEFFAFVGAGVWTLIVSIAIWRRLATESSAVRAPLTATV